MGFPPQVLVLVLRTHVSLLELLDRTLPLTRLDSQVGLVTLGQSGCFLAEVPFEFVDLAEELLFLESDALLLNLQKLNALSVVALSLHVLLLSSLQLRGLKLEGLVN